MIQKADLKRSAAESQIVYEDTSPPQKNGGALPIPNPSQFTMSQSQFQSESLQAMHGNKHWIF